MRGHHSTADRQPSSSQHRRSGRRGAVVAGLGVVALAVAVFVVLQMVGRDRDVQLGPASVPMGASPSDDTVAIPTTDVPNDEMARIGGRLEGDPNIDGGCLWLGYPGYERISVVWPPGYRARFNPIELVDPNGRVVARENDLIEANGGYHSNPPMERCRVSDRIAWIGPYITVVDALD